MIDYSVSLLLCKYLGKLITLLSWKPRLSTVFVENMSAKDKEQADSQWQALKQSI